LYFPGRNEVGAYLNHQAVFCKAYRKGLRRRKPPGTGVIEGVLVPKDLARIATPAAPVQARYTPHASQAQHGARIISVPPRPTKMMFKPATPQWPAHHFYAEISLFLSPKRNYNACHPDRSDA